jgi:alkylation response protein AidB-like acyl-CoA dehydrogenase
MTVFDLGVSEVGDAAGDAMREILARSMSGTPIAPAVLETPFAWRVIRDDGWDLLGTDEAAGGAGATLRDLTHVAQIWGEYLAPVAFIPALMTKRWSARARESPGPVTVSLPTRATPGRGTAPFGADPGIRLLHGDPEDPRLAAIEEPEPDDYAPSLRLATSTQVTALTTDQAAEIALIWAAESTGCATRALADAVAYAKDRQQFGQPIGQFQAVKHHLANGHMLTEQAETAVIWGTQDLGHARQAARYAMDASLRVIETAIQVHGGLGFTWEMGLHIYLRHVVTLRELTNALAP